MNPETITLLRCPVCQRNNLSLEIFTVDSHNRVCDGVIACPNCTHWYPIEDGLLDMLTGVLEYKQDRSRFWSRYREQMTRLDLQPNVPAKKGDTQKLQSVQQEHFDWYAVNSRQTYNQYELTAFWAAADRLAFEPWRAMIQSKSRILDVGCAQGRSIFKFIDMDVDLFGFDVSKQLVRQALQRYRTGRYQARATFMAADAMSFPFVNSSFDNVLVYGVLHHIPDIPTVCHEIARVLKPGGKYFGSENHTSAFRGIFELLQKINPLWHEEAGPEALLSHARLSEAFAGTPVHLETKSVVFLPPHIFGWMSPNLAYHVLSMTDRIGQSIPVLNKQGGLMLIEATHI